MIETRLQQAGDMLPPRHYVVTQEMKDVMTQDEIQEYTVDLQIHLLSQSNSEPITQLYSRDRL